MQVLHKRTHTHAPDVEPRMRRPGRLARGFRMVTGLFFLAAAPFHASAALTNPGFYANTPTGAPPITAASRVFWESWFLPNARYMGLLIAVFMLCTAVLTLAKGTATKIGFAGMAAFHVALLAVFGMWPYTIPAIAVFALMMRFDFASGPAARLLPARLR